jgi:hypothetical protein
MFKKMSDRKQGILNKVGYSYNDLTVVPAIISSIKSRKECNVIDDVTGNLPIFTAPMLSVVNEYNYDIWTKNNINAILPRSVAYDIRLKRLNESCWVALSLKEFEKLFVNSSDVKNEKLTSDVYHVCVDLANGHMQDIYTTINAAKKEARKHGYQLFVMTGNIANPETYEYICRYADVDYIRLSIGSGAGCFVDGTQITMGDGSKKNIENIIIGDEVLTIDGSIQQVTDYTRFKVNKDILKINNEITCTNNHKFFVIDKKYKNIVNENNFEQYGVWIEAKKLNPQKHLLIKRELE